MKLKQFCPKSIRPFVQILILVLAATSPMHFAQGATSSIGGTVDYAAAGYGPGIRDTWDWRFPNYNATSSIRGQASNDTEDSFVSVGDSGSIYRATSVTSTGSKRTSGTTNNLFDVAYGDSRFIAVGANRTMLSSSDNGVTWSSVNISSLVGADFRLASIDHNGSDFIAVGNANDGTSVALFSSNGTTWSVLNAFPDYLPQLNAVRYMPSRNSWAVVGDNGSLAVGNNAGSSWTVGFLGSTESFNDVHETGDGMAFIVGSEGSILRSQDAGLAQWQKQFSGSSYSFQGISSGNNVIVAVAQSGRVVVSMVGNGEYWEESTAVFPVNFTSVTYTGGVFYAGGNNQSILTSDTGVDWTIRRSNKNYSINDAAETTSNLLSVGDNLVILRSNLAGTSWSRIATADLPALAAGTDFYGIATNNNTVLVVGSGGTIIRSTNAGTSWSQVTNITTLSGAAYTGALRSILYDGSQYIAVGDNLSIFYSSNGTAWTQATSGLSNGSFRDIAKDENRYIAVGDFGTIYSSTDGRNWSQVFSGLTDNLYGIAIGTNRLIAVGENGRMMQSTNGTSWSRLASPTTLDLHSIVYTDSGFVAVGQSNCVFTSIDGIEWTGTVSRTLNIFTRIRHLNDSFYIFGEFGSILSSVSAISSGLDSWTLRNPVVDGATLTDVVYGNDVFVAVGDGGLMLISTDGENWSEIDVYDTDGNALDEDLAGVAYGNGLYLAVGGNKVVYSYDATSWNVLNTTYIVPFTNVSYGNGVFVATAEDAHIFTSEDGFIWEGGYQTDAPTDSDMYDAFYSEDLGLWVAAGGPAEYQVTITERKEMTMVFTSPDGYVWTRQLMPFLPGSTTDYFAETMYSVAFGNSYFLVSGVGGLRSYDGTTWTINHLGWESYDSLYVGDGIAGFVNVGALGLTRGFDPNFLTFPGVNKDLYGIAYGQNKFVVVGQDGIVLNSVSAREWTIQTSENLESLNAVVANSLGRQVAVGDGGDILFSTNGSSWTRSQGLPTGLYAEADYYGVAYVSSDSVETGYYTVGSSGLILFSANGANWAARASPVTTRLYDVTVAADNNQLVAVGASGSIITTTDGETWNTATSPTNNALTAIHYGNGRYMAVGDNGTVLTSTNGTAWTALGGLSASIDLNDVSFGTLDDSGVWLAVADSGQAFSSTNNGTTWTALNTGTVNDLKSVDFGNGNFTVVGAEGDILTTNDLENWYRRPALSGYTFNGVSFVGSSFTIVGDLNTILTSATVIDTSSTSQTQLIAGLDPADGSAFEFSLTPVTISAQSLDSVTSEPTGLTINFELVSGPATITTSNGITTVTFTDTGTVTIRAYNFGNATYAAVSEQFSYTVTEAQDTIVFEKIENKLISDGSFLISAETSSGEDVNTRIIEGSSIASLRSTYVLDLAGNATYTHTVTLSGGNKDVGQVTIEAYIEDSATIEPVRRSFIVSRYEQTITFADVGSKTFGDAPFNVDAIASGGGEVELTLVDTSIATLDTENSEVTILGAGTITINAKAEPSSDYAYGPAEADLVVEVAKASQTLQFEEISDQFAVAGTTVILRAQTFINDDEDPANSTDYPIVFSVVKGDAIVDLDNSTGTLTLTGEQGQVTIQAAQAGNKNVNAATAVQQSFSVSSFGKVPYTSTDENMEGSAYGNGRYVAVGQGGAIYRSDGTSDPQDWSPIAGPTTYDLYDVAFGNGKFVAVGFFGTVLNSADGASWTTMNTNSSLLLNSVAYGGDIFVAVASGGIGFVSSDGSTWSQVGTSTVYPLQEVIYGDSLFIAVGPFGTIVTSPDGGTWTVRDSGTQLTFNGVAYGDGLYVIVGSDSTYLFSEDGGVTWQRKTIPTETLADSTELQSVSYGATEFRVVGPNGLILSADAEAIREPIDPETQSSRWVKEVSVGTDLLKDVNYGGDRFVTVGVSGTIMISMPDNGLSDATYTSGGYRWSNWMGWVYGANDPWFYHFNLGWIYVSGSGSDFWMYSPDFGWMWTDTDSFPWIYILNRGGWFMYEPESSDPRYLYNSSTGQWESY